ncbi:MAG TPA: response regulator transcription factor [Tahibacter sp.]|uniref:response regulator transcription factor n=1 Tax=Tahibacter sp. TaxID=2056211 RepID=UPI002C952620|nr:response regulator transcription factor [Tahibacter sp.]HSX61517.1 response regulator transcription factor [Tahibacter sp.]
MNTDASIRILCVDDHPLLREGIAGVIEGQDDLRLVGEASNGREAVDAFRRLRPDVTLMDLQMPEMDGLDAIKAIRAEFPAARIIVLTTYGGDVPALHALRAGAQGYLLKSSLRKELLDAIRAVAAGRKRIPAGIAAQIAENAAHDALSSREVEILRGVAAGSANKVIAATLAISEETVKSHMKRILEKLDANDRTHAVTIALKRGIFSL